jgi:PAS domain S-box-containing protein
MEHRNVRGGVTALAVVPPDSRRSEPMPDVSTRRAWVLLAACAGLLLVANIAEQFVPPLALERWVVVHAFLEAPAVLIAALIVAVGLSSEERQRGTPMRFTALAFLVVGTLDGLHLLSYGGMPDLFSPNTWHRNLVFWLAARLVGAGALLALALRAEWPPWSPRELVLGIAAAVATALGFAWIGLARPELVPPLWGPDGLTPLKGALEWLVIGLHAVTLAALMRRPTRIGAIDGGLLLLAVGLMLLGELCFAVQVGAGDLNNVLGHVLKAAAFLALYRAVFVAAVRAPFIELRQRESELRASRELLDAAFAKSTTGKALVALDGTFLRVNESLARILDRPVDVLHGMTWMSVTHPDDLSDDRAASAAIGDGRRSDYRREKRCLRPDGSIRRVLVNVTPVRNDDGSLQVFLTEVQDVTAQRQAEEDLARSEAALRQVQKMDAVGRLAGGIAHDFNNLLTAILSTSALLEAEAPADDPRRGELAEITSAAKRGAGLTRQLLAFSRQQTWSPEPSDLGDIVDGFAPILQRMGGPGIRVVIERGPAALAIRADRGQVEQVLLNLVLNGRDALHDVGGGTIRIRTAAVQIVQPCQAVGSTVEPGRWATLEVHDDGSGIAPETLPKVFDPFFTTKPVGAGTGLGLATVWGIARQHGAPIVLESAPGLGTTFRLYFPLLEA